MPKRLPTNHSVADMRRLADALTAAHRAGDILAAARIREYHPRFIDAADEEVLAATLNLRDAELITAREHGFATWRQLEAFVTHPAGLNDFQQLSCLHYFTTDRPALRERAREMLAATPSLATRDIWCAACAGEVDAVAGFLDADATLVDRRGGYFDWQPLLYACYSRLDLPGKSTLAVARLLIERGADPNAHYMWGGQYRFTALTGTFGEGEMGPVNQPPHQEWQALARLLLAAGAHPNDGQALYNTMFTPGSECLEMLLAHGLSATDNNNWLQEQDGELTEQTDKTLDYQLNWAARNHHVARAKLLIDHGADVNQDSGDGRTLYECAVLAGHPDLAQYLADHGAETVVLGAAERFAAACMAADARTALAMLREDASLVARSQEARPELMPDAAAGNRLDAVRTMLEVGFDPNQGDRTALHQAAFHGHVAMAELLIANGANLSARDAHFAATPLQWALTSGETAVERYLAGCEVGIFDAALSENTGRLAALLDTEPALLETTIGAERTGDAHQEDWQTPLAFAVTRQRPRSVRLLLERGARVGVQNAEGRSLIDIAREQSTPEIVSLLEAG